GPYAPGPRAGGKEHLGHGGRQGDEAGGGGGQRCARAGVIREGAAAGGGGGGGGGGGRRAVRRLARQSGGRQEQAREVGAMCPAAHSKQPTPDGSGDGLASAPGAQRHHPSREGSTGGANGEVSWLRAVGSPSRVMTPSGVEPRAQRAALPHARYSGGAAPDSHRLP